ncbi:serine/threonine protein kinase [Streptomycetaceae bacterium NBC_01309]
MEPLGSGDPHQVGRFRLAGLLGAGGMGRVFFGRAPDGVAVAVKVVHPHLLNGGQDEFRARFVREVRTAREVDAAFTARVVAADADADVPWLATEFVPGIPLSAAVGRFGPLPRESLLVLASGLFAALGGIHAAGLVHRDIKPSNVMLGVDGPKVIDFGIARPAGATALTRTGQTVGTWQFMSPEQFERSDVGPESDVFSAGAALAYAATGRPPFPGDTLPVLLANLTDHAPDLTGLPAALAPLVGAALAKDPRARPTAAAARTMVPAPATQIGADQGWLPPTVTHAVLRTAATALQAPTPADDTTSTNPRTPSGNPREGRAVNERLWNRSTSDPTPFTADALLPAKFVNDFNTEYIRVATGRRPCAEAGADNLVAVLAGHGCTEVMAGVYLEQGSTNPPILVSVSVFPLPDDVTAGSVYDLVQGDALWKMTIWSAEDGDDTPRPGDSVSGYRWGHNRRRHRYLICTRAVRTDRATGDWLEPWLRAPSGRLSASVGPQNHHVD